LISTKSPIGQARVSAIQHNGRTIGSRTVYYPGEQGEIERFDRGEDVLEERLEL